MADPLSISAGIVGLISTAEVVFRRVYKYLKHVKDAEKEVLELSSEINSLFGMLNSVGIVVDELENAGAQVIQQQHITACNETLSELRELLSQFNSSNMDEKSFGPIRKKWKWPLSQPKTLELKNKIQFHKSTISLALTADGISATLKLLDQTTELGRKIKAITEYIEAQTRIATNEARFKTLDLLSPVNPADNQRTNNKLRHPQTGSWFLESSEFKTWISTKNSKLWVYGIPGAGKSILASAAIQQSLQESTEENAVAYFYCDYKNPLTHNPINILGSLAQQIAKQSEWSFEKLEKFVKKHIIDSHGRTQPFAAEPKDISHLIYDMAEDFANVIITVDGLDECGDMIEEVTSYLTTLVEMSNIKLFLSSRDLIQIRDYMDGFQKLSIAARNSDLKLYVASQIEERLKKTSLKRLRIRDPSLKGEIMDKLVEGAEGMFRWVALQLDYICDLPTDNSIRKALQALPPDLYSSYERLLEHINQKPPSVQTLVQRTLKWVIHERLEVKALCEAVSVEEGSQHLDPSDLVDEEEILRWCGSFVRKTTDMESIDIIELAHFTVKEFLSAIDPIRKPNLANYRIEEKLDLVYIARTSMTYLCHDEFKAPFKTWKEISERWDRHPLRGFAVWELEHIIHGNETDPQTWSLLKKFFNPQVRWYLESWAQEFMFRGKTSSYTGRPRTSSSRPSKSLLDDIRDLCKFISPIHYAVMLGSSEVTKWLLENGQSSQSRSPIGSPLQLALTTDTVFHWALEGDTWIRVLHAQYKRDFYQLVDILVSSGADVNEIGSNTDYPEKSILYVAIDRVLDHENGSVVVKLLEDGARCTKDCLELLAQNENVPEPVMEAIKSENVLPENRELLSLITNRTGESTGLKPDGVDWIDTSNDEVQVESFLHAAQMGYKEAMHRLLETNPRVTHASDKTYITPLHSALANDNLEFVMLLIEHGASINAIGGNGRTPLQEAMHSRSSQCFLYLLENGADPNLKNSLNRNLWHIAGYVADMDILKILTDHVNGDGINEKDDYGMVPLVYAIEYGDVPVIKVFLEMKADETWKDDLGRTILWYAAREGKGQVVKFFLDRNHDPSIKDLDGLNALYAAISGDRLDVDTVKSLIEYDATLLDSCPKEHALGLLFSSYMAMDSNTQHLLKIRDVVNLLKPISLDQARKVIEKVWPTKDILDHGVPQFVECLLATFDDDLENVLEDKLPPIYLENILEAVDSAPDRPARVHLDILGKVVCRLLDLIPDSRLASMRARDEKPLNIAVKTDWENVVDKILEKMKSSGTDIFDEDDSHYTALEMGCIFDCKIEILDKLLQLCKIPHRKHESGNSLLNWAAIYASKAHVQKLLDEGFQVDDPDEDGNTALLFACQSGFSDTVQLLLDHGANINHKNNSGWSSVHLAKDRDVLLLQILAVDKSRWTDRVTVVHNGLEFKNITILHLAIFSKNLEAVKYLLGEIPDFNIDTCSEGGTLLYAATCVNSEQIVRWLLENGANPSLPHPSTLDSPLHMVWLCSVIIVRLLLDHGANIHAMNKVGYTPRMAALKSGMADVAILLEETIFQQEYKNKSSKSMQMKTVRGMQREMENAIEQGDLGLVKRLAKSGASFSKPCGSCGRCRPLIFACLYGRLHIAEYLIKDGVALYYQTCNQHLWPGYTVLHYCAARGWNYLMNIVLDKCPGLLFVHTSIHPILISVHSDKSKTLKLMLERSSTDWERFQKSGFSFPLESDRTISSEDRTPTPGWVGYQLTGPDLTEVRNFHPNDGYCWKVRRLKDGERVSSSFYPSLQGFLRSFESRTPLHEASDLGDLKSVEMLLENGADPNATNEIYQTPLNLLLQKKELPKESVKIVNLLLKYGANPHSHGCGGTTPGEIAAMCGPVEIFKQLKPLSTLDDYDIEHQSLIYQILKGEPNPEMVNILSYLFQRGFKISTPDNQGNSGASALRTTGVYMQTYLLNLGIDLSEADPDYGSCLHTGWFDTDLRLLKRILKRIGKASKELLNMKPARRSTPMYYAVGAGGYKCLELMIEYGSDLDLVGGIHGTPLMLAALMGRFEMVRLLINSGATVCYEHDGRYISVLERAGKFPEIVNWLLYDRWREKRFIMNC